MNTKLWKDMISDEIISSSDGSKLGLSSFPLDQFDSLDSFDSMNDFPEKISQMAMSNINNISNYRISTNNNNNNQMNEKNNSHHNDDFEPVSHKRSLSYTDSNYSDVPKINIPSSNNLCMTPTVNREKEKIFNTSKTNDTSHSPEKSSNKIYPYKPTRNFNKFHLKKSITSNSTDDESKPNNPFDKIARTTRSHRNLMRSFDRKLLLPSHFTDLFMDDSSNHDNDILKTELNKHSSKMKSYDESLDKKNHEESKKILSQMIINTKDTKEQAKIYRYAAESNKKRFFFIEADFLYRNAENADSTNVQYYLDHAKLLDEIGKADDAEEILKIGLEKTSISDQIVIKLLKQFERRQRFIQARNILGLVYNHANHNNVSSHIAQSLAEGALFEIRNGCYDSNSQSKMKLNNLNSCNSFENDYKKLMTALNLLNLLEKKINMKSGYYIDLTESLKRQGYKELSFKYSKDGISRFPSMPNNWNTYLSLQTTVEDVIQVLKNAKSYLSSSTVSKIEQTASFLCAKYHNIKQSRKIISECIARSSNEQQWRILLNAALIEILYGNSSKVHSLYSLLIKKTPKKFYSTTQLSFAKFNEVIQDPKHNPEKIYHNLVLNSNCDWRVYLEYSMFLVRQSQFNKALEIVEQGLEHHQNNGRLWSLRIQLEPNKQQQVIKLKDAIIKAPKSGEVWTEAARISLNPGSEYFSLKSARFFLNTAFLFTPQYIDIFIEMVRLELLEFGLNASLEKIKKLFMTGDGNYGTVIYLFRQPGIEFTNVEFAKIVEGVKQDLIKNQKIYQRAIFRTSFVIESIKYEEERLKKDVTELNPYEFAFGISNFIENLTSNHKGNHGSTNNNSDENQKKILILGSSSALL